MSNAAMHGTDLQRRLLRLCRERPDFRRRLAREVRRKIAGIDDDYLSWQALHKMSEQAPRVLEMLRELGEDLEAWQELKLQMAAEYLDAVHDSLVYGRSE